VCADIERTGTDTQFYDKFGVRNAVALMMKYLWRIPAHRATVQRESRYVFFFSRRSFPLMCLHSSSWLSCCLGV
jgi:hypothetical protein